MAIRNCNSFLVLMIRYTLLFCLCEQLVVSSFENQNYTESVIWEHSEYLNTDFLVSWTVNNEYITFELQVKTLGYIGFGFINNENVAHIDMIISWIEKEQTYFQDRYIPANSNFEPLIDRSQDYILLLGYENATHSIIRFRRKLDTCDELQDVKITNQTMRIVYVYNDNDPENGSLYPGVVNNFNKLWRSSRPLVLLEKSQPIVPRYEYVRSIELRNINAELPLFDDTISYCKMFKLDIEGNKQHLIKYQPIYDSSWSVNFLHHMILYECQESNYEFKLMAQENSQMCYGDNSIPKECNAVVASWSRGSKGFTYPTNVGYPLELQQSKFYFMVTQYNNVNRQNFHSTANNFKDNSGLKIYYTSNLRSYEAGVLSIGIDPNWHHLIPPGQKRVVSEGNCLGECTQFAFPKQGINIFAVMMNTKQIGREIKLRQIRKTEELLPIAEDTNIDSNYSNYQGFRHLMNTIIALPGDRLIAECTYDSSSRVTITLGGQANIGERCNILTLYYPRQKKLTTCHSLPSLSTVLNSLGIESLEVSSNKIVISKPKMFEGTSFENLLLSYDWNKQFNHFQKTTLEGAFKPLCFDAHKNALPISEHIMGHKIQLTKIHKQPNRCYKKIISKTKLLSEIEFDVQNEVRPSHISESSSRSSRSSFKMTSNQSAQLLSCRIFHLDTLTGFIIFIIFIS